MGLVCFHDSVTCMLVKSTTQLASMIWELKNSSLIDSSLWDALVAKCEEAPLYMTYAYLSATLAQWDALVGMDQGVYAFAMVFPYRNQRGIKYIYQPPYIPYLRPLMLKQDAAFNDVWLSHLQSYRYIPKLFLATDTQPPEGFTKRLAGGYSIPLQAPYHELRSRYTSYRQRRLRKAERTNLNVMRSTDIDQFIAMHEQLTLPRITGFQHDQHFILQNIWKKLDQHHALDLWVCRHEGEIVAGFLLGKFKKTIYYLASASSPEGRQVNAITRVVDEIIRSYSADGFHLLDLGNAGFPGIDKFKKSFGAYEYPIYQLYRNALPWYIRIPKKVINTLGVSLSR